jgi:hypothetical protein
MYHLFIPIKLLSKILFKLNYLTLSRVYSFILTLLGPQGPDPDLECGSGSN